MLIKKKKKGVGICRSMTIPSCFEDDVNTVFIDWCWIYVLEVVDYSCTPGLFIVISSYSFCIFFFPFSFWNFLLNLEFSFVLPFCFFVVVWFDQNTLTCVDELFKWLQTTQLWLNIARGHTSQRLIKISYLLFTFVHIFLFLYHRRY